MNVDIEELFAPGGALSSVDPDYEHRPQQSQMAAAVWAAFEGETHLVVEAGTGVGKSLGYLLPGALWAASRGLRLIVSTHTRALQEQLMEKELPVAAAVLKILGFPLRYAMLMGADNYLCVQRLSQLSSAPEMFEESGAKMLAEISKWAETASTGHRSALPCLVPQGTWSRISRDPDLCLGQAGRYWNSCLYRKDRERAERAHVLVVNHALLLSGGRLPSFDALVIDEAHNLEETAVSRFGLTVSQSRYMALLHEIISPDGRRGFARRMRNLEAAPLKELRKTVKLCAEEGEQFFKEIGEAHGFTSSAREPGAQRLLRGREFACGEALKKLEISLHALTETCLGTEEAAELKMLEIRAGALRTDIKTFLDGEVEGVAHWVQWPQGRLELCAAPLEVGQRLAQGLFSRGIPVVLASATLSAGAGLKEFKAHVGLEGARELMVSSPFDYESQAALLVVDNLPSPQQEEASISAVAAHCREIIGAVPGGLFILFSSWKMLRRVHEILRPEITGRPIWAQGSTGSDVLLADFAQAGNAVLLGVDTFWQGVDVPGSALSCVVLVKLPFPNFSSPVEEARREYFDSLGRNYFSDHSLPRAVTKFRQGFGRLIRSTTDRGAVVILDSRILHKNYGEVFLEALPRCRRLESIEELRDFFKEG